MASEFFARKLNLELALNPLFHGPHEELREETPPPREVKVTIKKDFTQRNYGSHSTRSQWKLSTESNINSFEFKHRNPKGVYDFLKVKIERENARSKRAKIKKSTGKVKKVDETENGNGVEKEAREVIVEAESNPRETDKNGAESENNNDKQSTTNKLPETGSEKSGVVPEILHYSDEFTEGPLEVYEPVFVRFPVWKPAKLNHD
ncbi:uncharacterized protein LOC132552742 [Ylistrum balloti]|uniref:uncharacterized protein LOC132552742 n=1 Tax=Ylistrum balloti TaxID=509963 RepID=UPI002905839E|nr:uncharacterized protein LOC132552742 [Ylistrum balloti]